MVSIREIELERDAAEVVEVIRDRHPTLTMDASGWRHRFETTPARASLRALVAEEDDRVVGYVAAWLNFFAGDAAMVNVAVHSSHTRRGTGAALYEAGIDHALSLDPGSLRTEFYENEAGTRFAISRGYRLVRAEQVAVLDPRTVDERPPAGIELVPVRALDPHEVHAVDEAATRDMPQTDRIDEIPYDEWVQHVLDHPQFTLDGSFGAVVDGNVVALSFLITDLERGQATNMFTGTLAAYRGRGLGIAVKLASTRWAAEHGITRIATSNDETNAPMLAINRRLGYMPAGRRVEYVARATPASSKPRISR
jgi:GNAT superfamily N-acetyltransferase